MTEADAYNHGRAYRLASQATQELANMLPNDAFVREPANRQMALLEAIATGYFRLCDEIRSRESDD